MGPHISQNEKLEVMSKFMVQLMWSGYDQKYRYDIISGAIKRHREFLDKASKGEIRFYRNK